MNEEIKNETGLSNQDSQVNDSSLGNQIDTDQENIEAIWWEEHDKEYIHYFYKIINNTNGMFYYGIHSLLKSLNKIPEEDGYWGSGTEIRKAIKIEGKNNFTKEIIEIFETRLEVRNKEASVVTLDLVKSPQCYNRVVGGGESPLGKVCVVLKDNLEKPILIDRDEYYSNLDKYKTYFSETVIVKFKDDNKDDWFSITLDEYYKNKDKYITVTTGKVVVYILNNDGTISNKTSLVSKEDYDKYKNIKYLSITSKIFARKVIVVKKDDKNRKAVYMDIDDPRYLSGEYVGVNYGIKQSDKTVAKKMGNKNGSYGSMWITNGKENKKVYDGIIPNGWHKGRTYSKTVLNNMSSANRLVVDRKRTEVEILDINSGNIIKVKLDSIFFRKSDDKLISPEYLLILYKNNNTWNKVSKELNIGYKSVRKIKRYYESLGYVFKTA